jgi:hypothetical protein
VKPSDICDATLTFCERRNVLWTICLVPGKKNQRLVFAIVGAHGTNLFDKISVAEVIQKSEEKIRAELEKHFKVKMSMLESEMKAKLEAISDEHKTVLDRYQLEFRSVKVSTTP